MSDDVFAGLVGHEAVKERLQAALASPAHAYLFSGPDGAGVGAFARRFAAAICGLDEHALEVGHPDLREVRPEGTQIRIEQVRELWRDVQMRPFSAIRRAYLIWQAEAMPEVVQHALLKSIEEPPPHVVVILVTALPQRLLATVRSRCEEVRFSRLPLSAVAAELQRTHGLDPAAAADLARASGGDIARAHDLAAGGEAADRRQLYLALARAALNDPAFDAGDATARVVEATTSRGRGEEARVQAEAAERLARLGEGLPTAERRRLTREADELARRRRRAAEVEESLAAIDAIAGWCRDALAAGLGAADTLLHSDHRSALEEDATSGSAAAAEAGLEAALDARRALSTLTITTALVLEALFHQIAGRARRERLARR